MLSNHHKAKSLVFALWLWSVEVEAEGKVEPVGLKQLGSRHQGVSSLFGNSTTNLLRSLRGGDIKGGDNKNVVSKKGILKSKKARKRKKSSRGRNAKKSASAQPSQSFPQLQQENQIEITNTAKSSTSSGDDLAVVKAILVPRKYSIPQVIRLVSAFLFSSSLLECLRTSGVPFNKAVISTLQSHGMISKEHIAKISPLDIFWAKKFARAEKNLLPPKYLPTSIPLLGFLMSLSLYIGLLLLGPRWFVEWQAWLGYNRVNIAQPSEDKNVQDIEAYLRGIEDHNKDSIDMYHESQFINHPRHTGSSHTHTGLAVLVRKSKRDRDMAKDSSKTESIQWLLRSENGDHPAPYYIELEQRRVYCHITIPDYSNQKTISLKCLDGGPSFFVNDSLVQVIARGSKGLSNVEDLNYAQGRFAPYNDINVPIPTVNDAFVSRLSSPLAVLQLVGKLLTALEENFLPAMLNVLSNLGQHYMNAKKSIIAAKELSNEIHGNVENERNQMFWTLRPKSWEKKAGSQILPGDVFYLPSNSAIMPVDAVILEGGCLAQEAVITGESVPQAKIAVEPNEETEILSIETNHRNSALFAGTTIINGAKQQGFDKNLSEEVRRTSSPVKCLALKTGSYSSKGEIMRALSKSSHAGDIATEDSERDSIRLIAALTSFAIIACTSMFLPFSSTHSKKKTSSFRRVIQCTRIVVASIPDLPLALSSVFYSCGRVLRNEAEVVCSEPGSLLTASQINVCVFDKTGTLTSDTQAMTEVVNPFGKSHLMENIVLAGCHSLDSLKDEEGGEVFGDPLDIASLDFSGWRFNSSDRSATIGGSKSSKSELAITRKGGKTLWQIKTFPFDPSRRCSYALLLVQHADQKFRLWKVVKGSPDRVRPLLKSCDGCSNFYQKYDTASNQIGSRLVTLAAEDVTHSDLSKTLFPRGLPNIRSKNRFHKDVRRARVVAEKKLHTDNFVKASKKSMDFVGFGCFNVSIRPSTARVIKEIIDSGTNVCMLTGDGSAAALDVARKSNFFAKECRRVAALETRDNNQIVWKIIKLKSGSILEEKAFNLETTGEILEEEKEGKCAIMITGAAIENDNMLYGNARKLLFDNLSRVSVFSRSSPQVKQHVLSKLKSCGSKVMMCGDGVNDISAMKTADTSAALLNGFGVESAVSGTGRDVENDRRRQKAERRRANISTSDIDVGQNRVKLKLEEAISENQDSNDGMNAVFQVLKDEFKRAKDLKRGGAAAARILQEEEDLKNSIKFKSKKSSDGNNEEIDTVLAIKPGEASLAAPFTFLRPCIDGAEAIIRVGIAAAANSISVHRSIALNSLMACYNLATLYRDGFRYGDHMWNVELGFIMSMDKGLGDVSCMPRPRIYPLLRPSQSIFNPADGLSVLLQASIHLFVLTKAVTGARLMEGKFSKKATGLRIRLKPKFGSVSDGFALSLGGGHEARNFLGRKPFHPNHVTNAVFLISIIQNVSIAAINHAGYPFHGSLLESRTFTLAATFSILFCVVMVLEVFPLVNKLLQLAPMTSKAFQLYLLFLFLVDGVASCVADGLCTYFFNKEMWKTKWESKKVPDGSSKLAADIEEHILHKEKQQNAVVVRSLSLLLIFLTMASIAK